MKIDGNLIKGQLIDFIICNNPIEIAFSSSDENINRYKVASYLIDVLIEKCLIQCGEVYGSTSYCAAEPESDLDILALVDERMGKRAAKVYLNAISTVTGNVIQVEIVCIPLNISKEYQWYGFTGRTSYSWTYISPPRGFISISLEQLWEKESPVILAARNDAIDLVRRGLFSLYKDKQKLVNAEMVLSEILKMHGSIFPIVIGEFKDVQEKLHKRLNRGLKERLIHNINNTLHELRFLVTNVISDQTSAGIIMTHSVPM